MARVSVTTDATTLYTDLWAGLPAYADHAPGLETLPLFLQMAQPPGTVLDAGAGSGKAAVALVGEGFDVTLCDLTDAGLVPEAQALSFYRACLWKPLRPQVRRGQVDWVYCVDVMEHIPPQFTMLAVDQMLAIAERGVFLGIALTPDHFGLLVGEALHQTVQSFVWWRDSLRELGTVVEARDLLNRAVFLVTRAR